MDEEALFSRCVVSPRGIVHIEAWFGFSLGRMRLIGPAVCIARSVAIRKSYRLPNATKPLFSDALAAGTRSQELLR